MPKWYDLALKEVGVKERPENRGPDIRRYISLAHAGSEGDPWCAIFANAMLESAGVPGSRSAGARSFEWDDVKFVQLKGPSLGAIVTFWRGSRRSGLGHVGFYAGETRTQINVLGGNEHDQVMIELLPKDGNTFGFSGYWWPKGQPLPKLGPLPVTTAAKSADIKVV